MSSAECALLLVEGGVTECALLLVGGGDTEEEEQEIDTGRSEVRDTESSGGGEVDGVAGSAQEDATEICPSKSPEEGIAETVWLIAGEHCPTNCAARLKLPSLG